MAQRPILRVESSVKRGGTPGEPNDQELVERVRSGQAEAFTELVVRYQDRLFNTCWRICGNLEDAQDVTQEAFMKAYQNIASFRGDSAFYTWLYRVAVNLALSQRRSKKRRPVVSLDGVSTEGTQVEPLARKMLIASQKDTATAAADAELAGRVLAALHSLKEDDRAIVVLRDMEGLDYEQIGRILELPAGTVKSRLHRARMELRKLVQAGANSSIERGDGS
ncbi:MAG: sigma-70 family RNA polymerase sigma factor [Planctomycetota bacterium]